MILTLSRRPASFNASMLVLNIGIVVVRKAENPTISGWCSLIASIIFSGGTLTPRSMTRKPAPLSITRTRTLADVVDIALDGQNQESADGLGALGGQQRAQDLQAGLHRLGADQHLGHEILSALEQRAHLRQGRDQRLVQNFRRFQVCVQSRVRPLHHGGRVAVDDVVVELILDLFGVGHGRGLLAGRLALGWVGNPRQVEEFDRIQPQTSEFTEL